MPYGALKFVLTPKKRKGKEKSKALGRRKAVQESSSAVTVGALPDEKDELLWNKKFTQCFIYPELTSRWTEVLITSLWLWHGTLWPYRHAVAHTYSLFGLLVARHWSFPSLLLSRNIPWVLTVFLHITLFNPASFPKRRYCCRHPHLVDEDVHRESLSGSS